MRKMVLLLSVVFASSFAGAGEIENLKSFNLKNIDLQDLSQAEVPAVTSIKAEPVTVVEQDLEHKFKRVARELGNLRNDTVWLDNDLRRLESEARRIKNSNQHNPFFENDLRRMSYDINRYANDADRILRDVQRLVSIAKKSEKLHKIARDMEWDARDMYNDAQFQIENAARNLEWVVRSVKPEIIGYQARWYAYDINRYARDYSWGARDLYYAVRDLERKTQPDVLQGKKIAPVVEGFAYAAQAVYVWWQAHNAYEEYHSEDVSNNSDNTYNSPNNVPSYSQNNEFYNGSCPQQWHQRSIDIAVK